MANPTTTPNKWIPRPELRAWLYGIGAAIGALLIGYGVVTAEQGQLWLSLLGAIVVGGNATAGRNLPRE